MGRDPRYIPPGGAMVEITTRTIQGRYLLRPDPAGQVNEVFLGILGHAQKRYGGLIHAVSGLSSHYHLLATFEDALQMGQFMRVVNGSLSLEIGRLHDWSGPMWDRRYRPILVTEELEAQLARLKYVLAAGAKEGLVDRPEKWPGVQSVDALLHGEPLRGVWFDRTAEYAARSRGEAFGRYTYATEHVIALEPLPALRHLTIEQQRETIAGLVAEIEEEAAVQRRETGRESLGTAEVMSRDPHAQPATLERSPAPRVHAFRKQVRQLWQEALATVFAAYREAAGRLRQGDLLVDFPPGTYPPARPFAAFSGIPP